MDGGGGGELLFDDRIENRLERIAVRAFVGEETWDCGLVTGR